MAWLEFHQTMPKHRKTLRLASLLRIKRREAIGLMADLWCWALDSADNDGRLPGITQEDLAEVLEYPRKKGNMIISALVESGYMDTDEDGTLILHDWNDYAGKLNEQRTIQREQGRIRQQRRRDKIESNRDTNADVTRDKRVNNEVTVPNPTVPNISSLRSDISNGDLESFFESLWKLYPRKEGKGSVSKTQKQKLYAIGLDEMIRAVNRYKAKIKADNTEPKYIKQGSTFFNSGYVDYLDENYREAEAEADGYHGNDAESDTGQNPTTWGPYTLNMD